MQRSMGSMTRRSVLSRTAGAPISWGVCEMPGWGVQLPAERVLAEMAQLGLRASELGSIGYLPTEADPLRSLLDSYGISLIGGFNALTLADDTRTDKVLAQAEASAALLAAAGATEFVSCAVSSDEAWERIEVTPQQWRHAWRMLERIGEICAEHGLVQSYHPHVDSLVETADEILRVLESSPVRWVLDTAHLRIGGLDPVGFAADHAERVQLVHLKDLVSPVAARLNAGELSFQAAVQEGMFAPLGMGDIDIAAVIGHLERSGFSGWYVIEQDAAIAGAVPPPGEGPIRDVRTSVAYLRSIDAAGVAPRSDDLCAAGTPTTTRRGNPT